MKLILRQAFIVDKNSTNNGQVADILINNGIIEKIGSAIDEPDATIIANDGLTICPGWIDIFSNFNDPGFEHKETLETGSLAASAGGYTCVFTVPNTLPVCDNKSAVEYIVQKSKHLITDIIPLGAISKKSEGKELAEIYDMHNSGAVAFSDGLNSVQNAGLLLKALQYVKAISSVIVQMPISQSIGSGGLMNEGIVSTQLGLPGTPAIGEELFISRDIELAKYTGSKLHITGISTAKSLALIEKGKKDGVNVSCSVTPYHLYYCDEDLITYDTNLKTNPPLRTRDDMLALREGIMNGKIDCIASHHFPQDWDSKTCEFEYAKNGMISLETSFGIITEILQDISNERLADLFSHNARNIFSLEKNTIEVGKKANITMFSRKEKFEYNTSISKSKSNNSPFFNKSFPSKVIGIINKDKVYLNN